MSIAWGLDLDMSAVRLMRRDGTDWVEHSVEKIDSPDIEERLHRMIGAIDRGTPVSLFLPRDQILFTEVTLDPSEDPRGQIERAMDGRTPYTLDELSLDWELTGPNEASVAAIARDTLDEAAAFAEVRGLPIAGYSTLFAAPDFPRMPAFDGPNIAAVAAPETQTGTLVLEQPADPVTEPETAPTFATARTPSRPPDADVVNASMVATAKARLTPMASESQDAPEPTADAAPKTPVVQVDDATPVVQVKAPQMPLDPGLPIAAPNAPPRVRTDIGAESVSVHTASLTPPGSALKTRRSGAPVSTAAIFAVALFLMIGVAVLVWNYLPMRPTTAIEPPTETGQNIANGQEDAALDTAALAPSAGTQQDVEAGPVDAMPDETDLAPRVETDKAIEPDLGIVADAELAPPALADGFATAPVSVAEPAVEDALAVALTDAGAIVDIALLQPTELLMPERALPVAAPQTLVTTPAAPLPDAVDVTLSTPGETFEAAEFAALNIAPDADGLPSVDTRVPNPQTPAVLAAIQTSAPFLGPEPDIDETTEGIYFAAFELPEIATDAIALPAARSLTPDALDGLEREGLASLTPAPETGEDLPSAGPDPEPQADVGDPINDPVASAVAQALADALTGPGGLIQTSLAANLPRTAPRARPGDLVQDIERQQFGGRTRDELSTLRPPARPVSIQAETEAAPPSDQAVANSFTPRNRPDDFGALVSAARAQQEAARVAAAAALQTPDTSGAIEAARDQPSQPAAPTVRPAQPQRLNIPTSASVARAATIEDAIRLNRVNLVGVYGSPSDRRALVRLPSGRYVKVKVGDRVDGGTVAQITDKTLLYRKGNRTLSLEIPQG